MPDNTGKPQGLTPKEIKEIQDFLKSKGVDIQIRFSPQRVRRIDDGSLIIDAPQFQTSFVRIKPAGGNGKTGRIETI